MKKLSLAIIIIFSIGSLPLFLQYGGMIYEGDYLDQIIPFIVEIKRQFASGTPYWSWNTFFGENFIADYSPTSPFTWFCCLFSVNHIVAGITIAQYLKFLCMGIASFLYFKKMGASKDMQILGGIMYSFSSFTVSNLFYGCFHEPMICFPLLLIAVEKVLRKEKFAFTILASMVFLTVFINYYISVASLLLSAIYGLCRLRDKEITMSLKTVISTITACIIGVMMASVVFLPVAYQMIGSPRNDASAGLGISYWITAIERLANLFYPKFVEGYNQLFFAGYNSTAAFVPVAGIFFAAIYWIKNKNWLTLLLTIILVSYLTPINGVFTFFTNPYYTRWAFALTLFIILASIKLIDEKTEISKRYLVTYSIIGLAAVALLIVIGSIIAKSKGLWDFRTILNIIVTLSTYTLGIGLLFFYHKRGNIKFLSHSVYIFCALYLLLYFSNFNFWRSIKDLDFSSSKIEAYLNAESKIPYNNKDFKFRTYFENDYRNTSLLKNTPGVKTFNSWQNNNTRLLFLTAENSKSLTRVDFKPQINIESFLALMSVKEFVNISNGEYKSSENPNYIPMGFCYDYYTPKSNIQKLIYEDNKKDIPLQMLNAIAVDSCDEADFAKILKPSDLNFGISLDSVVMERNKVTCTEFVGTTHGFSSRIECDKDNFLFFSVPYDEGFTAYVDTTPTKIYNVNLGMSAIFVQEGNHTIQFEYYPRGLKTGLVISIISTIILIIELIIESRAKN